MSRFYLVNIVKKNVLWRLNSKPTCVDMSPSDYHDKREIFSRAH